jgi:L-ascorbate metabolism protein UlaG (beta-lactamase superfamily)
VPIHVIGGIASDATAQETRGFVDTIRARDVIGASYYTFPMIRDDQWRALRSIG